MRYANPIDDIHEFAGQVLFFSTVTVGVLSGAHKQPVLWSNFQ